MTMKNFSEAMNQIGDQYINESVEYKVAERKATARPWVRFGAVAACMAILLGGAIPAIHYRNGAETESVLQGLGNQTAQPGGDASDLEEIDPIIASIAVFPPQENIRDVESATITPISEEVARATDLGAYLPSQLPDGFHFKKATLYETTMKNGTQYSMLYVTYTTSDDLYAADRREFTVQLYDHTIPTDKTIFDAKDLPGFVEERADNSTFHVSYGDIYVGMSPSSLTNDEILAVLGSIVK